MSTAAVQEPVQQTKTISLVEPQVPAESARTRFVDEHPFGVVGIFILISLAFASTFVAAVAIWLYQIRYSGVLDIKF